MKPKMVQPLWKSVWRFLKNVKIELPYDPATPLLEIHPKELKAESQRDLHSHVHSSIIHNSQMWKQPKCPVMDEWIKKCSIYIQWNIIDP